MKKVIFHYADGQTSYQLGNEVSFHSGSVYVDGEQTVIYNKEIAEPNDVVAYKVKDVTTLRELLAKKPGKVLKRLNQLNIGLSNTVYGSWASKWSIGYHDPTIREIIKLKELINNNSCLVSDNVDRQITLQTDWSRHFGNGPTGPML